MNSFDSFHPEVRSIYTPLSEAVQDFISRKEFTPHSVLPEFPLLNQVKGKIPFVLFRQIATPNYETHRFLHIVDTYDGIAIFIEYHDDIFAPQNYLKKSWGKITFVTERGKKGGLKKYTETIIDFNTMSGSKIRDVTTHTGQKLVDYHAQLFTEAISKKVPHIKHDASQWFEKNGNDARNYYENYLAFFVKDAILCENFVMSDEFEARFVREIVIPAFTRVEQKYGKRPLIVPIVPPQEESDEIWLFHSKTSQGIQNIS